MARREIFAGNWKMYKTHQEALDLAQGIRAWTTTGIGNREVIIFPPAPYAKAVAELCRGSRIDVGMQNMHFEQEGAFTGEVAAPMLAFQLGPIEIEGRIRFIEPQDAGARLVIEPNPIVLKLIAGEIIAIPLSAML